MNRKEAEELLKEVYEKRTSEHADNLMIHSKIVAYVAEKIAKLSGLDPEKAYIMGLLHDVGRSQDRKIRHTIIGYRILKEKNVPEEIARITITHLYILKDGLNLINQEKEFKDDEYKFVKNYLKNIEYDDYDKLIQISDLMGSLEIQTIEERMFSVFCRYDIVNNVPFCQQIQNLKDYFEEKMGTSIYKPFKDVLKNRF